MPSKIILTSEQIQFLKSNYGVMKNTDLRDTLGLSQNVFYKQLKLLGLSKQIHKTWTEKEINYLLNNYDLLTNDELISYFNRSIDTIQLKARELGLSRSRSWSDSDLQILNTYFDKLSQEELLSMIPNKTWSAIKQKAMKLGLSRKVDCIEWSDEELNYLKNNYSSDLKVDIIKALPLRSWESIIQKANKLGLYRDGDIQAKDKGYYFNADFFKHWSDDMAWFLGWLITDGCITKTGAIKFNLHKKDIDVLDKLGSKLMKGYKIKSSNNSNCAYITMSNKEYIRDLLYLGIGVNKTWTVKVPDCPINFESHLIRGLIEGDGTVRFDKYSNVLSLHLCGNEYVVNYVVGVIYKRFGYTSKLNYRDGKGGRLYYISYYGINSVNILTWLYTNTNSSNRLDRKYNIFKQFMCDYGNKRYNLNLIFN